MIAMSSATSLIDSVAQVIRTIDGDHTMGAGELAEHIVAELEKRALALEPAIRQLREAINNCGSHPEYHDHVMQEQRHQWPTLWLAIDKVLEA